MAYRRFASICLSVLFLFLAGCSPKTSAAKESLSPPASVPALKISVAQPMKKGLSERTLILTYHDIIPRRTQESVWFDCTIKEFKEQLVWLKSRGANFITVDQLHSNLTQGASLPHKSVLVTFADNYQGFYRFALPLLRKEKIPSMMFVHTGFVGSKVGRPKMDWNQLQELSQEGLVEIASQTVTHPADLSKLSSALQRDEIFKSKDAIRKFLNKNPRFIAYPNGKFNAESKLLAKKAGYQMAFAESQTPAQKSSDIFSVNRYVHTKLKQGWTDCFVSNNVAY